MDDFPPGFAGGRNSSLTHIALPFRRVGLVASSGSFSKRMIAMDQTAPVSFATARHHSQTNDLFY
jgi:hypothetical protein